MVFKSLGLIFALVSWIGIIVVICSVWSYAADTGTGASSSTAQKPPAQKPDRLWVYLGTYTRKTSQGIYLAELHLRAGRLELKGLAAPLANPSFLAIHPSGQWLYAVGEMGDFQGKKQGAVSALAIQPDGTLKLLNQQPSGGPGPCHLTVDPTGRYVVVANYSGGSIASLPVAEDGRLKEPVSVIQHTGSSVHPQRQQGPHAHSVHFDPTGKLVIAADLGVDKLFMYRLDLPSGKLTPHEPAWVKVDPGAGPRHFAFHPTGRFAYVINELASTITAFSYQADAGRLEPIQTVSTLPEGFTGSNTTAEVQVHPSGRFLYGSNRGHDSLAIFAIDPATGKLTAKGHQSTQGRTPRNFGIDPTGQYLLAANQDSDNVVVFRIDAQTGQLTPTGHQIQVSMPVCVKFLQPKQ
ncbi:MAG: lactonase family protein [Thermoguttaceae bacterium]|nr:lactonase family protein [Thermoguttaceae bacterium]MDW8038526.1 lactonase family protein [Thermoguttaceae bacterium]